MPIASGRRRLISRRSLHAGLPTPGGFCITADAYRRQIAHLGLRDAISAYANADTPTQRRLAVEIRLKLYQSDLAPDVLADVLTAWWAEAETGGGALLLAGRRSRRRSFAGQFESFLGITDDSEFLTALRACWAALWTTTRGAPWRSTISIRPIPRWRCWCSR